MSTFIHPSSRAAIPPGSSTQIVVTGPIGRNASPGTTATIEFLARPFRGTYPVVNRAAYLLIGVPHVSTKKVTFTLLMLNCKGISLLLKQKFLMAIFINKNSML
jgi:hypothetical protein